MVIFYLLIFEQCFIWSQFYVQCLKAFQEHIFLVWHAFGKMIGGVLESQKVSSHTIIFLLAMSFPCCSFHIKKKKKAVHCNRSNLRWTPRFPCVMNSNSRFVYLLPSHNKKLNAEWCVRSAGMFNPIILSSVVFLPHSFKG